MNKVKATPAARKQARENNVDLYKLEGRGPNGRIHLVDILEYVKENGTNITPLARRIAEDLNISLEEINGTGFNNKIMKRDIVESLYKEKEIDEAQESIISDIEVNIESDKFNDVKGRFEQLTPMRSTVARRMSDSYFSAPAFTMNIEVDATELNSLRFKLMDSVKEAVGEKLTVTDLLVMAISRVLKKHPTLNSAWTDQGIFRYEEVNIALAVGLDEGLYVPVIRNTDNKSLKEIVAESKDLVKKVKTNKLMPSQQEGNTFTISNVGMYGITTFTPIINMPSSAILGVGATVDRVVPINGEIEIRPIMNLSLTVDHRVVDGTPAAAFLKDLKELLENPYVMFI